MPIVSYNRHNGITTHYYFFFFIIGSYVNKVRGWREKITIITEFPPSPYNVAHIQKQWQIRIKRCNDIPTVQVPTPAPIMFVFQKPLSCKERKSEDVAERDFSDGK